MQGIRTAYA